jgi:murein DD-endopeptidase MepM/ murein hydrolase activator NlpD
MSTRTLQVETPYMSGADVRGWQTDLLDQMHDWDVDYPLEADGVYGVATRALGASVLYGLGIDQDAMRDGVAPALRVKVRNKRLTATERARYDERSDWRRRLAEKHAGGGVAPPLARIVEDAWGYHPGVHDGIDLICTPRAPVYAVVAAKVVDVRASGWWGDGARASGGHAVEEGDGIIQLEVLRDVGPFRRGMHLGYGHAEGAVVEVGQTVEAGRHLGHAGFAIAWHVHFMVNGGNVGTRGIGDRDPRPFVDYAVEHG